jgi:hypothetical protein
MVYGPPGLGKGLLSGAPTAGKRHPGEGLSDGTGAGPGSGKVLVKTPPAPLSSPPTQSTVMKTFTRCSIALATAVTGMFALAADEKKSAPAVSEEEMMKNWMAAATPGAPHKVLDVYAGEWTVSTKMWMQPGAPPMETEGTASAKWILGGRFVEMTMKSEVMGQPFEGRALTGYSNMRKAYQSFWIDNMGTSMTMNSGTYDAATKTFTFEGKMDDPMTGAKDKLFKFSDKIISNDEIRSEGHDPSLGKDSKMMEMVYKRKK